LLAAVAVLQVLWNFGVRGLVPEAQIYAKMSRLGAIAGLGRQSNQTPTEYAHALALALPAVSGHSRLVATRYSAVRYGAQASPPKQGEQEQQGEALAAAWETIRRALVGKTLRRLVPGR